MIAATVLLFFFCLVVAERLLDDLLLLLDSLGLLHSPVRRLRLLFGRAWLALGSALLVAIAGARSLRACLVGHGHVPGACPDLAEIRHLCFDALTTYHGVKGAVLFVAVAVSAAVVVSVTLRLHGVFSARLELSDVAVEDLPVTPSVPVLRDLEGLGGCRVVGILHPVIVVPRDFEDRFSREEQRAAILHELGHLDGYDPWIYQLAIVYRSIFAFLPGPGRLLTAIRGTLEERADDWAVRVGGAHPQALALSIARSAGVQMHSLALAGDTVANLHRRIERLTGRSLPRRPFPKFAALRVFLASCLLATGWLQLHCLVEAMV